MVTAVAAAMKGTTALVVYNRKDQGRCATKVPAATPAGGSHTPLGILAGSLPGLRWRLNHYLRLSPCACSPLSNPPSLACPYLPFPYSFMSFPSLTSPYPSPLSLRSSHLFSTPPQFVSTSSSSNFFVFSSSSSSLRSTFRLSLNGPLRCFTSLRFLLPPALPSSLTPLPQGHTPLVSQDIGPHVLPNTCSFAVIAMRAAAGEVQESLICAMNK